jgi:hypothetical protein
MKKLLYILFFFLPAVVSAQFNLYKDSPLDYAWKNVGNAAGFSAGRADWTCLTFSPTDGQPYVVFKDFANSQKATVMRFDGTTWVYVGSAGFSTGMVYCTKIAFSLSGQLYVAFSDTANSWKATVMKFDGTNWVNVGNDGFSAGETIEISLAISPSGEPYVAYSDWGNSNEGAATVMKFDGTNWINVGNAGFTAPQASWESLAFSSSGQPYLAYVDEWNNLYPKAMKFDGLKWVNVGNGLISTSAAGSTSLVFSSSDSLPYVAYQDLVYNKKASVMKFDGTNWVNVGYEGFTEPLAYWVSFAFSLIGEPYVAYSNWTDSGKAYVMKFDKNGSWVPVAAYGFSAGFTSYLSLGFSPIDGSPYVAYRDNGNGSRATVMKYDSVMVGINEQQETKLFLYPNPVTDKLTIEISGATQESNLAVFNIECQQLITRQITEPKTQLDISTLPSGVYFVRVTNNRTVEMGKFIKQ